MYICVCMGTKTISISEEAYTLLKNMKEDKESFTDAIIKVAKKDPLSKLVGILTKDEASELRRNIKSTRRKMNERIKRIGKQLK